MDFSGKTILITGGTGSFGNAACQKFLKTNIKEIRILSRDEAKQDLMRTFYDDNRLKFYIGDVRDFNSIECAFKNVDYVFHAAALKQVPSCEFFPIEAVKTNVLGSDNVIKACLKYHVKKAVFLSTDKAVYPINVMGMSKALMEKNVIAISQKLKKDETILCLTRYGNVMGSRGSVIPLFLNQIKQNKPLTITNPDMTRFMMSLDEALDLVLYAFEYGEQGDLFVKKDPAATIDTLADAILEITHSNVKKNYIGTRHGEKLYETLISSEEMFRAVSYERFYKIVPDNRDLNYHLHSKESIAKSNLNYEAYTSHNTKRLNKEELKKLLLTLNIFKEFPKE